MRIIQFYFQKIRAQHILVSGGSSDRAQDSMTSNDKFCLKWNDFRENLTDSFNKLREDCEFSDVTLVCEENQQIEAHRVILSACSPFFSSVLKKNKHSHPMIYMRGIKAKNLVAIMDFIYQGETNIYQEDLDAFLALAEDLKLKGLTGANHSSGIEEKPEIPKFVPKQHQNKETVKEERFIFKSSEIDPHMVVDYPDTDLSGSSSLVPIDAGRTMVTVDSAMEDVKARIYSMMEKFTDGPFNWKCSVCGKPSKDRANMARHIESHIDGVSYPCDKCGKISRSANALKVHKSRNHNQK